MHNARSSDRFKSVGPAVTFWSLAYLQSLTNEPVDGQLASTGPEQVMVLLHVGEARWTGMKVHVAAGGEPHAIPECLKSTIGMDTLDDSLSVPGLTTPRVKHDLPPTYEFGWLFTFLHFVANLSVCGSTVSTSCTLFLNDRFGSLPDAQYTSPDRPLLGAYRTLEQVVIDSIW